MHFLNLREWYDEKELKDAIMDNSPKILLELDREFAFVSKEYLFFVGGTKKFIDMLFYNISKHRYVLIEVKTRALIPEIWDN